MSQLPPRSTLSSSSAASDVYKRQGINAEYMGRDKLPNFIKTKLENLSLKYYSTISLFHSIFYHYPSEDVYADGIELPLPTICLLYTSPSPRDRQKSRMPSSA
eukprot:TRINITY_DN7614_c0_g1_i1.p1 TRINITY_DN7614_c0_g1~~TRINITY_DN7614_c0_g1_i1.p1  ORF type:complete len:103 (-),score=28.80 TRINITY_DN7614_c0_g1_i1:29-337(-)